MRQNVTGINTARSLTIKDGRINHEQMAQVSARLAGLPDSLVKIVVTHHPFDLPDRHRRAQLVGRADSALQSFATCGADLLLAGHLHASHAGTTDARYPIDGYAALVVQAGTATSNRGRGEANSFNVIRIASPHITTERYAWDASRNSFELAGSERFVRSAERWSRCIEDVSDRSQ